MPKPNSEMKDASPSEQIPPYVRIDILVFSMRKEFFLRKKNIESMDILTLGEKPVASAAPSIPILHGKMRI